MASNGRGDGSVPLISIRPIDYRHPDVQLLVTEVQRVYVQRYGNEDVSPIDAAEFDLPNGLFLLATVDGVPAAMGGWRRHPLPDSRVPTAEVRRMYVSPHFRGSGLARAVLAQLEVTARDKFIDQMILETGLMQPEALELYRSSGYQEVPAFGHYAGSPLSVSLGKRLQAPRANRPAGCRHRQQ
ncbi:MAG: GNAT family N-acetyltransferase [Nakamurella sp.]